MDLRDAVAAYLARAGVSQSELAKRAGVSQASVSRAQMKPLTRHSEAQARLFTFIQEAERGELHPTLKQALATAWDRTDRHAEALASLISASRELWPGLGRAADDDE